jgi:hypothetical protein
MLRQSFSVFFIILNYSAVVFPLTIMFGNVSVYTLDESFSPACISYSQCDEAKGASKSASVARGAFMLSNRVVQNLFRFEA